MGNKGFAITGIIYTLLILFLMILVTVIAGLRSTQKMLVNSTKIIETRFNGKEVEQLELTAIKAKGIAEYSGKYLFEITNKEGVTLKNCVAYLKKGTNLNNNKLTYSPSECNNNIIEKKLIAIYSLEVK